MPLRTAALGLSTILAASCLAAPPAHAAAGTQTAWANEGYPYPSASDCVETPGVTTGCIYDQWHAYQGQCVSWVAHRLNTISGLRYDNHSYLGQRFGSANNWGTAASRAGIPVNMTPARGAVAWYNYHAAFVEYVNPDGSVVVSEMNYDNHNGFRYVTIKPGYRWPKGFIHFKDLPNQRLQYRIDPVGALFADTVPARGALRRGPRVGIGWEKMGLVTQLDDITGDRLADLLARRNSDGLLFLYPSAGGGRLGPKRQVGSGWLSVRALTDAGSMRGSGRQVVAVYTSGEVRQFSVSRSGLSGMRQLAPTSRWTTVTGIDDVTQDGRTDLLVNTSDKKLLRYPSTATGALGRPTVVSSDYRIGQLVSHERGRFTVVTGTGALATRTVTASRITNHTVIATGLAGHRPA